MSWLPVFSGRDKGTCSNNVLELKKFKPAVGVEIGEDELFSDDIKDITDLVEELVAEREGKKASK